MSKRIEVRDLTVLEDVYRTVLASRPTRTGQVRFSLEADSAATTALERSAVADARERARRAAQATGSELGDVKLIDSSGQACSSANLLAAPAPGFLAAHRLGIHPRIMLRTWQGNKSRQPAGR